MYQEGKIELNLEDKKKEKQIVDIFKEIQQQILVDNNDILDDLNPLISQLNQKDKNKVLQSINKHFPDHEFVRLGNFQIQDQKQEQFDYKQMYIQNRENKNYESILQNIKVTKYRIINKIPESILANIQLLQKLQTHSLLIFDLLDYSLDLKELSQSEILTVLLQLFYCNTKFNSQELNEFEQLIGSLLQKQLYEINYYTETLKQKDQQNYEVFVQFLQQYQLRNINDSDHALQLFLQKNKQYHILFMTLNKEISNSRKKLEQFISSLTKVPMEQSNFNLIEVHINKIENVDENLNYLYIQIVFFYWKQYCLKFNLQVDLKSQEDSLQTISNDRKLKFIERYLNKQKQNNVESNAIFVYLYF